MGTKITLSKVPELPQETVEQLQELRGTTEIYGPLVALHEAGWSLASLAQPLGVTREAVRLWLKYAEVLNPPRQPALPPPLSPFARAAAEATRAAAEAAGASRISQEQAVDEAIERILPQLLALQEDARSLRGPSTSSPFYAEASAQYTSLLHEAVAAGVPVVRLANALQVQKATIYSRLRRGGYRKMAPSEHRPQWAEQEWEK